MKKNVLFLLVFFSLYFVTGNVCADEGVAASADAGAIFDALAKKAGKIGSGLREVGYAVAGLGLIVFSFMAIFNKISWKNLAYIMLSTFMLSAMVSVISYISDGKGDASAAGGPNFGTYQSVGEADEGPPATTKE